MDVQLKQIGERLRGLREVLDIPAEEVAELCGITTAQYESMEAGDADVSVAKLQKISKKYGIALDVLLFGEEPHMSSYYLTRRGEGLNVSRNAAYRYESLGAGFRGRRAEPFMVTVDPKPGDIFQDLNTHDGQEFEMVMEGRMEVVVGKRRFTLETGDSIYFDSTQPHAMRALDGKPAKFFAIIL